MLNSAPGTTNTWKKTEISMEVFSFNCERLFLIYSFKIGFITDHDKKTMIFMLFL